MGRVRKGFGVKGGIAFKIDRIEIIPYVNYWNIKDSEVVITNTYSWMEPHNKTVEAGIKICFTF